MEFNHLMVYVRDVNRSLPFYRDLLGFKLIETMPGYARLRSPGSDTTIALHELGKERELDPEREGVRAYFEVRSLDKLCERLKDKGVRFLQMPKDMEWGWRHAYLRDPDGHEISLYWAGEKRLRKSQSPRG